MKKKVLFISSTGGHLSEMLQLAPLFDKYDEYLPEELVKKGFAYGVLRMDEVKDFCRSLSAEKARPAELVDGAPS